MNRKRAVLIIYLLIFLIVVTGMKAIYNKHKTEIQVLEKDIEKLEKENQRLIEQKETLQTILNRNKKEKEILTIQIEDLELENEELRTIRAKVTAYSPLDNKSGICADSTPTTTATGKKVSRGIVAVNPRKIPYGTKLYIPGYGQATAEDTGEIIRQYDGVAIDVLVDSYEEAQKWGVKYMDVKIGGSGN